MPLFQEVFESWFQPGRVSKLVCIKELMRGHFRKVKYFQACGNQSTTVFVITNLNHQYSRIWNRAIIKSEIEKTNKCQGAGGEG